jgi:hypothetical protein
MRRLSFLFMLPLALFTLAACDTATDLDDVSIEGTWDGVGSLYANHPGVKVSISEANGVVTGSWWWPGRPAALVTNGTYVDGVARFNLTGFPGGATFEGRLTDVHRMEGTLGAFDGDAVFRRSSVRPAQSP